MLGFAKIAGGMPSSAGSMTDHLMNQTLSPEQARLAAYYGRGMVQDNEMLTWAQMVADGTASYGEALDVLLQKHVRDGGDLDQLQAAEERIGKRLADLAYRVQEGLQDAPLAIVRPDIHPLALAGLGIEADGLLSREEINALLAGRRADGELVEGKHYVEERKLPVDPKTGEERFSTPIGSYDFCPTPDKTVSVAWAFAGPVEQAMIYNAHIEAAREAVGYMASEVGKIRIGNGGKDGTEDGHVAWLEFTHHTSRRVQIKDGDITRDAGPGDPDLHTHFLVPNAVFGESGKVGSLDTAAIGGFIFEADAFYHARLGQKGSGANRSRCPDQRRPSRQGSFYAAASTAFQTAGVLLSLRRSLPRLNCPFRIRRSNSMPAIVSTAVLNCVKPSIGPMRSLTPRWSCSIRLFRYFDEAASYRRRVDHPPGARARRDAMPHTRPM